MKMREPDSSQDKRQQAQIETRGIPPECKCSNVGGWGERLNTSMEVIQHLTGRGPGQSVLADPT